jgi:preprotein translocase subunit SecA
MPVWSKLPGDPNKRELRRHQQVIERINALEPEISALSDSELRARTDDFRRRLGVTGPDLSHGQASASSYQSRITDLGGEEEAEAERAEREAKELEKARQEALDELLPEAFAVVREAARRTLGLRHFDVQLIGGIVLHQGKIAEMKTGEGKTLVATLPLYLNALEARGCHLVTVNDYLARRDAGWNGPLYHALGLTVGVIIPGVDGNPDTGSFRYDPDFVDETHPDPRLQHLRPCTRREAYAADITYATNNELGFDYLRDNMAISLDRCVQRRLHYAIVDEVDSILIDEARTPLIISGQGNEPTEKYYTYANLVKGLDPETDYTIDEKTKSATITDEGAAKVESRLGISNIFDLEHAVEAHQLNQGLRARALFLRDRDYIVNSDGEVVIVDEFTGRTMPGRRWSDGLHQAIEAKEGVRVQQENITLATITFQNFFRIYDKLAGMTGTALTEAEEFHKIYKLEVVPIPTHRPMVRSDESDLIFKTEEGKFRAVIDDIVERYAKEQPVLVGTTSIEKSERLSRMLEKKGVQHNVLNAKMHEREAAIVAEAGQPRAVTIATNMAGRGTDIVLGEGVTDVGGLYIIGTERHESRRIDNQLRGRSGRQGDPGESRFYLSFEDDLMRVFGGERMQGIMDRLHVDEDTPLESRMVSRSIEGAQSRVEGYNFDARRHVVEYDDVMNKQREIIYGERRKILEGTDTRANLTAMIERIVGEEVPTYCQGKHRDTWDLDGLWERMRQFAPALPELGQVKVESLGDSVEELVETISGELVSLYEEKEGEYGAEIMRQVEQTVMLQVIDAKWTAYLTQMDHLREGIGLQAYGQKDPLVEYKQAAFESFQDLTGDIQRDIVRMLLNVQVHRTEPAAEPPADAAAAASAPASSRGTAAPGNGAEPPAARPAAAAASGALARATGERAAAVPAPVRPGVRNVVESSAAGTRRADVPGGAGLPGNGRKVGRNQPCPCGSGKKYKFCHGRA